MTAEPSQIRSWARGLITFAGVAAALWMLHRLERIVVVLIAALRRTNRKPHAGP